jgi:hypothetical protein
MHSEIVVDPDSSRRISMNLGGQSRSVNIVVANGGRLTVLGRRTLDSERSSLRLCVSLGSGSSFEYIQAFELPSGHAHAEIIDIDFVGKSARANINTYCAQSSGSLWIQESSAHIEARGAGAAFKQSAKSLRLGQKAHAMIEPNLMVGIDEASASHGAAQGSPSAELLHAMQARGFELFEAMNFAKDAFLSQAIEGSSWENAQAECEVWT